MAEEKNREDEQPTLSNTDLAFERTMLAEGRTLMAWIRTSISMISFGFTIYKFFEELKMENQAASQQLLTPRIVGMLMMIFALLGLLLAQMEYHEAMKRLRKEYPGARKSSFSLMAILIWVFGMVLFLGALFRQ